MTNLKRNIIQGLFLNKMTYFLYMTTSNVRKRLSRGQFKMDASNLSGYQYFYKNLHNDQKYVQSLPKYMKDKNSFEYSCLKPWNNTVPENIRKSTTLKGFYHKVNVNEKPNSA